jgi:dephospho-CoA kinase
LGFPVYNSDFWAKELVNFDENLKSKIINFLAKILMMKTAHITELTLLLLFLRNEDLLHELNKIIHPAVKNISKIG